MKYKKYGKKSYKRKKNYDNRLQGLAVEVRNNNVDLALKKLKKKIKDSNLMMDLKERQYYKKKSTKRRERLNKVKSRIKYQVLKEKESKKY